MVQGLSRELRTRGCEVDISTMAYRDLPRIERMECGTIYRCRCVRLRTHACSIPEVLTYIGSLLVCVEKLMARKRYDLVHAHFILPDGMIAGYISQRWGTPFLITAHGTDVPGFNPHRAIVAHRVLRPLWSLVVSRAARVIAPSISLKLLISRQHLTKTVTVIPNGLNVGRYRTDRARQPRILAVSRILERKGLQFLIEAFQKLNNEYELHIVGDGQYLPTLRQMARPSGARIRFWGWLDRDSRELQNLYETSRLFVLPSLSENFPMVLLEAMSAGLAIVTTCSTGCAEVVGETGMLVEPGGSGGLETALSALTRDPGLISGLGRQARKRAEMLFDWPSVAERYIGQYREVLGGHLPDSSR
jgi:glycosyltransferase involved in cell wall biosynthesis